MIYSQLGLSLSYQILFELSFDDLCRFEQQSRPLSNEFWRQKLNYDFPQGVSMLYDTKKLHAYQQFQNLWSYKRRYVFFYIEGCVTASSFRYLFLQTACHRVIWSKQYTLFPALLRYELQCRKLSIGPRENTIFPALLSFELQRRKLSIGHQEIIEYQESLVNKISSPCNLETIWVFYVNHMSKFEALQHIDPRTFLEDCLKYTGALPLDDWNQIAILNTINQTIFFEHGNVETVQRYLHKYDFDYLVNEILNYDPVKYCSLLIRCQRFAEFTLSLNKIDLNNFLLIKLWLIPFVHMKDINF